MCQVSKMTHVKSLFESQFGPYICYFNYISIHFFFNFQFHPLQIDIKFNFFYIHFIMIFLLNILIILSLFYILF